MKFASIIAIAAAFAFTAEAYRGKIPRRFRNSDGALVGCSVEENPDGPFGHGFMHQREGEAAFIRTCWKDLDFWDGFDYMEDPHTMNINVYSSTDVADCM